MSPSREEALFALALEKPAEKRAAILDARCDGDAAFPEDILTPHFKFLVKRSALANTPPPQPITLQPP